MRYLFIAEKPSLMRSVEDCYRHHEAEVKEAVGTIEFLALSGHVCCFAEPKDYPDWNGSWHENRYPIIPEHWKVKAIPNRWKQDVLAKIRKSIGQYDGYIVGTDSDQEGYGIYYLVEQYLGLQEKPTLRFMEHSLTEPEILKSLLSMTDYHKDPVHVRFTQAFLLRSHADWLYGMNGTMLMTLRTGELMTVGRVKAPTLKLVYDNSMAIERFVPKTYYHLTASYPGFAGVQVGKSGQPIAYDSRKDALAVQVPKEGTITAVQKQTVRTRAPKLYDLTALQGDAGQMLGLTPSQTLETVQSLYEKHKVISYPRTQCRYVSTEKAKEFPDMLKKMAVFPELKEAASHITQADIKRVAGDRMVVNDVEIAKESHDALLPTSKTPKLSDMTERERDVCRLIYTRLLAQFLPPLKECKTKITTRHGDAVFQAQGKLVEDQGWRSLYGAARSWELPDLKEGAAITTEEIAPVEKTTTPPKRLTQTTLVLAMKNIANQIEDAAMKKSLAESQGIGTPATRDAIVTDLIRHGYIQDKRGLHITESGKRYIEQMEGMDLCSPVFAASLDMEIKKIQRGEASYQNVYRQMLASLHDTCRQMEQVSCGAVCPVCGEPLQAAGYLYQCANCGFQIGRKVCGQAITPGILDSLREHGETKHMAFRSKEGKEFRAKLVLKDGKTAFSFDSGLACPYCGKEIRVNQGGFFCDCGLTMYRTICGKKLTDRDLETLLKKKSLPVRKGFRKKDGSTFSAALELDEKQIRFPAKAG